MPSLNSARAGALVIYLLVAVWRIQSKKVALLQCLGLTPSDFEFVVVSVPRSMGGKGNK